MTWFKTIKALAEIATAGVMGYEMYLRNRKRNQDWVGNAKAHLIELPGRLLVQRSLSAFNT